MQVPPKCIERRTWVCLFLACGTVVQMLSRLSAAPPIGLLEHIVWSEIRLSLQLQSPCGYQMTGEGRAAERSFNQNRVIFSGYVGDQVYSSILWERNVSFHFGLFHLTELLQLLSDMKGLLVVSSWHSAQVVLSFLGGQKPWRYHMKQIYFIPNNGKLSPGTPGTLNWP